MTSAADQEERVPITDTFLEDYADYLEEDRWKRGMQGTDYRLRRELSAPRRKTAITTA